MSFTALLSIFALCLLSSYAQDVAYPVAVTDSNGNNRFNLQGAEISGNVFIRAYPVVKRNCVYRISSDVSRVRFFLDGDLFSTENISPFYLAGDNNGTPNPFDTRTLTEGWHSLRVVYEDDDGEVLEVVDVRFRVRNGANARLGLLYSETPNRNNPRALEGATLMQNRPYYIFWDGPDDEDVQSVTFWLDASRVRKENISPYDFAGTADNGNANGFRFMNNPGRHTIKAIIESCDICGVCTVREDDACFTVRAM